MIEYSYRFRQKPFESRSIGLLIALPQSVIAARLALYLIGPLVHLHPSILIHLLLDLAIPRIWADC